MRVKDIAFIGGVYLFGATALGYSAELSSSANDGRENVPYEPPKAAFPIVQAAVISKTDTSAESIPDRNEEYQPPRSLKSKSYNDSLRLHHSQLRKILSS